MRDWIEVEEFDWDWGNIAKNLIKHGIECREAEEVFFDEKSLLGEDSRHSAQGKRFFLIGKNYQGETLVIIFTQRGKKIRIISARRANRKERREYEQNKKN